MATKPPQASAAGTPDHVSLALSPRPASPPASFQAAGPAWGLAACVALSLRQPQRACEAAVLGAAPGAPGAEGPGPAMGWDHGEPRG